ncbi:MAG: phage Gp37/Gp68 family protein [Acidovorax sp.]|uniref:phage Gp37/Gp68 family protein n=1 Tax=Acidovorax sp. TaxID=1872122 RepID=UPI0025B96B49|nr:phage Gp37/Gp68 family protein [Acidovorax sp.]MCE1194077.1 phage Gp37/Gp68 family protein [Acidovorax sp.]
MSENTKIEWCDHTFNPWIGCTKISPGCDHCYAENLMDKRMGVASWSPGAERVRTKPANWKIPLRWNAQADAFMAQHGRRQRVFCASLADVFDNAVPMQWRMDLFELIADTPNLDWLILTKRIGNVMPMCSGDSLMFEMIGSRVWLGATIVNQADADRDIPKLLEVPARVRFLSMEPLLGSVDPRLQRPAREDDRQDMDGWCTHITTAAGAGIHWVIVGGESGPGARPMHPDWPRSLRDQCNAAGVPFLFKQWGEWTDFEHTPSAWWNSRNEAERNSLVQTFLHGKAMVRIGKKAAGRLLDGRTWDGFPL